MIQKQSSRLPEETYGYDAIIYRSRKAIEIMRKTKEEKESALRKFLDLYQPSLASFNRNNEIAFP